MQLSTTSLQPVHMRWLRLAGLKRFGALHLNRLYRQFGSSEAMLSASVTQLTESGLRPAEAQRLAQLDSGPLQDSYENIARWLERDSAHHLLTLEHADYPQALKQIDDPPPLLYLRGDPALLAYPQLAVVGSRKATAAGLAVARDFSRQLSLAGLVPSSGLALGIDAAAHEGALQGLGLTVAVLGTGIDQTYPARHRALAEQIVEQGGTLVSELPLGSTARAAHFPRRNRIISGLSRAVLVVEAAIKSGSLITARLAAEQGRDVFAIPGSIHNPQSQGGHHLIRQGAILVTQVQQILEELAPQLPAESSSAPREIPALAAAAGDVELNSGDQRLLAAMGWDTVGLDQLVTRLQLPVHQVQSQLLALELRGLVVSAAGGYQRLVG